MDSREQTKRPKRLWAVLAVPGAVALLIVCAGPWRVGLWQRIVQAFDATTHQSDQDEDHAGDAHAGRDHAHSETQSLKLSRQARLNLGLTLEFLRPVQLQTYRRTITVPAVIVGRPGRTNIKVATPLTGVVDHVHAVTGEAVRPGTLLFEIRLTHEDLVQTQTDFLKSLGELDVEEREIVRLKEVAQSGAVAGKSLLERQYSKEKLEALLQSQREALRLHGLSDRQIEDIARQRRLLRELQITVPSPDSHAGHEELKLSERDLQPVAFLDPPEAAAGSQKAVPLVIEELNAQKGQSVAAGEPLCTLADYSRLYIEGKAFEQDARALGRALQNGWTLTAAFDDGEQRFEETELKLAYIANAVDPVSRALSFFVDLPNEILRDRTNEEGQRFLSWKYRVGQRLELRVPVEEWPDQLVLPAEAVAREGAESYVFQENGDQFERVPVHVRYRDQQTAVIANDGSLYPGDIIALRSAHQLQMALKNKSGGGVDPHAGHNH
jgi:multidrug efflux pump subunit AcrA (membrane-fusion protein)